MLKPADVAVLGAGVVGMATAYALARQGMSVIIVDRHAGPAFGASFANGAQLSYSYTDALGHPRLLGRLPGLALGADPAFRLKLSRDPEFIRWIVAFVRNCTGSAFTRNTLEGLTLAAESRIALDALLRKHPLEFDHASSGKMLIYRDYASFERARRVMEMKVKRGAVQEQLSFAEGVRIEPALDTAGDVAGVIYSPQDEVGDPHRFAQALLTVLREDYAVISQFGSVIKKVERNGSGWLLHAAERPPVRAAALVICAGAQADGVLRSLGKRAPILPMKGYSLSLPATQKSPRVSLTDTSRKIVFCRLGSRVRIAGLAELGARDVDIDSRRLSHLARSAESALRGAGDFRQAGRGWAGLRPMSATSLPIIEQRGAGLVVNIGHGMLGWTFAMGAGERAARLLMNRRERAHDQ